MEILKASLKIARVIVKYLFWISQLFFLLWLGLQQSGAFMRYIEFMGRACVYTGLFYVSLGVLYVLLQIFVSVKTGEYSLLAMLYVALGVIVSGIEMYLILFLFAV